MKLRTLWLVCLSLLAACSSDDGMGPDGGGQNRAPQSLISAGSLPRAFVPGEQAILTAASVDPDGDDLTHRWSILGTSSSPGSLSATTGASVTWTAGSSPGGATIQLISNDGTVDSPVAATVTLSTGTLVAAGDIADGTVWAQSGSPYVVTGNIRVPSGSTLHTEAGVQVYFRGNASTGGGFLKPQFVVEGAFEPRGVGSSRTNAVSLRGGRNIPDVQWSGVLFRADGAESSHLHYCRIEEAETGVQVSGTAPIFLYYGQIEDNVTGISISDPDGTTPGQGVVSTLTVRGTSVFGNRGLGILLNSSNLYMRRASVRNNAGVGVSITASTDNTAADVDSTLIDRNGGDSGVNLRFSNDSSTTLFTLRVHVRHSNFSADPSNGPITVAWGGCAFPSFAQDFDLTGNFWGVATPDDSALPAILATMTGYGSCDATPADWQYANGDWVSAAHFLTGP